MFEQFLLEALVRYETSIDGEFRVRFARCSRCRAQTTLRTARMRKRVRLLL